MDIRRWTAEPLAPGREQRLGALAAFAAAVVFRVALFLSGAVTLIFDGNDSGEYRALAESLLRHRVFGWDGVPKMNRTPGYPAFLAAVFATLGRSPVAIMSAQIALEGLTCVMVFDLACRLRLSRLGTIVATFFSATCIFTAALSYQVMTESLYTFGLVASVWLLPSGPITRLVARRNRWRLAASGLTMSCTALVRPIEAFSVAGFVLVAGVMLVRRVGPRRAVTTSVVVAGLVFIVGSSAALVPWMARNRIVFHEEYEKPNHDHVTLLGFKTDVPVFRHWYSPEFTAFRRSYEEPMVMEFPYEPPSIARWVYPDEEREVTEAFRQLSIEIRASQTTPIAPETLRAFARIAEKRYAAAPRLHVTAPASRAAKLWVAPRASILIKDQHGGTTPLRTTVLLTLYDLSYVVPGLLGLLIGFRQAGVIRAGIWGSVLGHTAMHTFWHSAPHSRYMVPLFPLLCLGIGVVGELVWRRRHQFAADALRLRDGGRLSRDRGGG